MLQKVSDALHERSIHHSQTHMTKDILVLCSNAYWPSIGGVENSLRHLAKEAVNKGIKVVVVTSDIGVEKGTALHGKRWLDGASIIRYSANPISVRWLKPLSFLFSLCTLFVAFRRVRKVYPHAKVIARHHLSALAAIAVGFKGVKYLIPSVIKYQVSAENNSKRSVLRCLRMRMFEMLHTCAQRRAIRLAETFVFSNEMVRQVSLLMGKDMSHLPIVKPGVDPSRFFPIEQSERDARREELGLPKDSFLILFVGRFVAAKGVDLLIEAIALGPPGYHVVLVGAGEEEARYVELIHSHCLHDRVHIIGHTRHVEKYYQVADLFVMCSRYEPLGQTILEALCSGLLVVAFHSGNGVDTATEELNMSEFIVYAKDCTPQGLAVAIRAGQFAVQSANKHQIAQQCWSLYSWSHLLDRLLRDNRAI